MKTVYDFTVKDRKGNDVSLKEYANEVLLIVNTATKCGFTPSMKNWKNFIETYRKGFEILDPCNQFGQQAPGTDDSIHDFYQTELRNRIPSSKKVNGDDAEPLYVFFEKSKGF